LAKQREYTRKHIDSVASEKDILENISLEILVKIGYKIHTARNILRRSILLWNLIDSWYRGRVYSGGEEIVLVRNRDEASSGGSD